MAIKSKTPTPKKKPADDRFANAANAYAKKSGKIATDDEFDQKGTSMTADKIRAGYMKDANRKVPGQLSTTGGKPMAQKLRAAGSTTMTAYGKPKGANSTLPALKKLKTTKKNK